LLAGSLLLALQPYVSSGLVQLAIFAVLGTYLLFAARHAGSSLQLRLSALAFLAASALHVVLEHLPRELSFILDTVLAGSAGLSTYRLYEIMLVVAVSLLHLHFLYKAHIRAE
jgi:hypothetical protein